MTKIIVDAGMFYAPYIPINITQYNQHYRVLRKMCDIDATWYTIILYNYAIHEWIFALDSGWRFAANMKFDDSFSGDYDLREDMYMWLELQWNK